MWWTNILIVSLLIQALLITSIDGSANRRRRRRQTSGSLYGTNANLGASAPAGFNYPASYNINGVRLNNADARDLYGNPIMSSSNTENSLSSVNLYNQQRLQQQQQLYGTNDQSLLNNMYNGNSFYSGSGTNQLLRDTNGNLIPSGSAGSFYSSSNAQMSYPANTNQVLTNKDLYGTLSNTNNNQYGYNSNQLPNSNSYGGPMGSNSNLLPNSNTYGSMGSNTNLVPNSNTYSGYMGTYDNNNAGSNSYNYNRYGQNSANARYPNRDMNTNNNNNNNRYSNPNLYPYNNSYQFTSSICLLFLSVFVPITHIYK